ncbi:MAG: hypothetical protein NVS3B20_08670 [Polyangiales bacterium]
MRTAVRILTLIAPVLVACGLAGEVAADPPYLAPSSDSQAVELQKLARDKKTNFERDKARWGRAEAFISAPMAKTREAVLDYGNYSSFIPRFEKSKLLKRDGLAAEVFLQLPILKGSARLWALERFAAPVPNGKGETIKGSFIKGNVDDMQAVWHYRPVDDKHSIVTCEIYAVPKLVVPEKLMIGQLEDACGEAVLGVRDRAESLTAPKTAKTP